MRPEREASASPKLVQNISLTEFNSGITQKLQFGVNTTVELKCNNSSTRQYRHISRSNVPLQMSLFPVVVVMFLSSIVVLTPMGQFLDCVTVAFSDRYERGYKQ